MATTKIPPQLSAQDKSSFAYKTIKDRLPVILVKTIDFLHRQRSELHKYGLGLKGVPNEIESKEIELDVKEIIAQLAKLRKELETNKTLELLEELPLESSEENLFNNDIKEWNAALEANKLSNGSLPRWFESPWLLVECYMYRKMKEIFLKSKHLKMFDPFVEQKQSACRASVPQMSAIAVHLKDVERLVDEAAYNTHPSERSEFALFMELALWANKSDLSISGMSAENIQSHKFALNIKDTLDTLQENVLCDNMSEAWFKVKAIKDLVADRQKASDANRHKQSYYIDLVADNSGYELFVDFCLLHFLTLMLYPNGRKQNDGLLEFRIHVKRMPWFVSDALKQDVDWLINFLSTQSNEPSLQALGREWKSFIDNGLWRIYDKKFWTLPHDYSEMKTVSPGLYDALSGSRFIIFKGDLNYRKLVGDRKWHVLTPFNVALRNFSPAPLVALRTAKADVVVGITDINIYSRITNNELPRNWMLSGNFGLIQYFEP